MKQICVKWSVLISVSFLISASAACIEPVEIEPEAPAAPEVAAGEALRPFYVASFDHVPTEEEIQADLERFVAAAKAGGSEASLTPVETWQLPPLAGNKLVRIHATTSNIENAGTESDKDVSFIGVWVVNATASEVHFKLDYPSKDELNRNTTDVFYYTVGVGVGVTDWFMYGRVSNVNSNGWHCQEITLWEYNRHNTVRLQSLPFNQWVDKPNRILSSPLNMTNGSGLTY